MPNTVAVRSSTSELNCSHFSFVTMTLLICIVAERSSPGWKFAVRMVATWTCSRSGSYYTSFCALCSQPLIFFVI